MRQLRHLITSVEHMDLGTISQNTFVQDICAPNTRLFFRMRIGLEFFKKRKERPGEWFVYDIERHQLHPGDQHQFDDCPIYGDNRIRDVWEVQGEQLKVMLHAICHLFIAEGIDNWTLIFDDSWGLPNFGKTARIFDWLDVLNPGIRRRQEPFPADLPCIAGARTVTTPTPDLMLVGYKQMKEAFDNRVCEGYER